MNNRNWLAPVALAGEYPVSQLEVHLPASDALFGKPVGNLLLGFLHFESVQKTGVHHNTRLRIGEGSLFDIAALYNLHNRKTELLREVPVPLIMGRNRHDSAGTVGHENVVGYPDRDLLLRHRVHRGNSLQAYAGLVLGQLGPLKVRLPGCRFPILGDGSPVLQLVLIFVYQRVFGRNNHISSAEERIGPCCVDTQNIVFSCQPEIHLRSLAASDPVLLGDFYLIDIINEIQILDQSVRVLRNLKHPLALHLTYDRTAAAFAYAVHDLLIRQSDLTGGTPVDRHLRLIGKPLLIQLEENPLRPLIIRRIRCINLAAPVKGIAERL